MLVEELHVPDHRYEMTFAPKRERNLQRWWCDGSRGANSVASEVIQAPRGASGPSRLISLLEVSVHGKALSTAQQRELQAKFKEFFEIYSLAGRCIARQSGGIAPVLLLVGTVIKNGELEKHHLEFSLLPPAP
jgi:hypothetical protein